MTDLKSGLETLTKQLDDEWLDGGFLYKLRECEFDAAGYVRLERLLNSAKQLDDRQSMAISREFVRLLWFVPQFMEWQTERLIEHGADAETVHGASSNVREMVGQILGEP